MFFMFKDIQIKGSNLQFSELQSKTYIFQKQKRMIVPKQNAPQLQIITHKIAKSNGQFQLKKYVKGKFLGKGGFAKCYQGYDAQKNQTYAVKIIEKQDLTRNRAKQKLLSEIKIHKALRHKHIVEFYSVFEDQANVYLILELCPNKSLSEMVKKRKKLTVIETKYFMMQLISAMSYMHENKVIHRDLKMGNIFMGAEMELKVGDLGLAAKIEFIQEKKRTMCGTPNYIAPEIIEGATGHSYEVDLWSAGVICFAMLFGKPPFQTSQVKNTYKRIKNCEYDFPNTDGIPAEAKDFIKKILVLDPKKRLTLKEMLAHPFLSREQIPAIITYNKYTFLPNENFQKQKSIYSVATPMPIKQAVELARPKPSSSTDSNDKFRTSSSSKIQPDDGKFKKTMSKKEDLKFECIQQDIFSEYQNQPETGSNIKKIEDQSSKFKVLAYVDYSTKYGLGYVLNNQSYGVYFNDSSLMSLNLEQKLLIYIDNPAKKESDIQTFVYTNQKDPLLPQKANFQKKVLLLNKFVSYLNDELAKKTEKQFLHNQQNSPQDPIYVKQWLKTKHAIMFSLSNKVFQVDFFDNSQILLNTSKKSVEFRSKRGDHAQSLLQDALLEQDTQMSRRIKYTKEILNSLRQIK